MASEPIDAQIVAEPVRPELWATFYVWGGNGWQCLLFNTRSKAEQFLKYDTILQTRGPMMRHKPEQYLVRIPAQVSAPAPAPDRRDELLREARRLIGWYASDERERATSMTVANMGVDAIAFLSATAPAPVTGGGAARSGADAEGKG